MTNTGVKSWRRSGVAAGPIVGILLFLGLGGAFLAWSISQFSSALGSRGWAVTDGVIVESRYIDRGPRGDGEARVRYTYVVDGRRYEGRNLLPGTLAYTDRDEALKVQQYRPGRTVPVHYDPGRPQVSSLEVGVLTRMPFIGLALALPFLGAAMVLLWRVATGRAPTL